jgi:hypothetical protein
MCKLTLLQLHLHCIFLLKSNILGTFTLASLAPVVVNTSETVITRFTPLQRDCYSDDEFHLKAFNWDDGFRYSMTNCLYAAQLEKIVQNCSCVPNYFINHVDENMTYSDCR